MLRPTRLLLPLLAAVAAAACPSSCQPECSKPADCGSAEQPSTCASCPAQDSAYCEGGSCTDAPGDRAALQVDLTTPRNLALGSVRFAVVATKSTALVSSCAGRSGCVADTITCEQFDADGLGAAHINVALSGARNLVGAGGSTSFPDIPLGDAPLSNHLLWVEGRTGALGEGDTVAAACVNLPAGWQSQDVNVVLQAK